MANLTQTPGSVLLVSGSVEHGTSGASITAGMPVYKDASDSNKIKIADANDTAAKAAAVGIALNGASAGQPVAYQTAGVINLGATLTVGTIYCVSDTAGSIMPHGDLSAGEYVSVLGTAITAANLQLKISNSGVQVPA